MTLVRSGKIELPFRFDRKKRAIQREKEAKREAERRYNRLQKYGKEYNYYLYGKYTKQGKKIPWESEEVKILWNHYLAKIDGSLS